VALSILVFSLNRDLIALSKRKKRRDYANKVTPFFLNLRNRGIPVGAAFSFFLAWVYVFKIFSQCKAEVASLLRYGLAS